MGAPQLEEGKHDAYAWVGVHNLALMMEGRTDGDHRLRDIVARAIQFGSSRNAGYKRPLAGDERAGR